MFLLCRGRGFLTTWHEYRQAGGRTRHGRPSPDRVSPPQSPSVCVLVLDTMYGTLVAAQELDKLCSAGVQLSVRKLVVYNVRQKHMVRGHPCSVARGASVQRLAESGPANGDSLWRLTEPLRLEVWMKRVAA